MFFLIGRCYESILKSLAFAEGQGFLIFIRTSPGRSEASSILIIVTDMSHTQLRKNNHARRGYMTLRVELYATVQVVWLRIWNFLWNKCYLSRDLCPESGAHIDVKN